MNIHISYKMLSIFIQLPTSIHARHNPRQPAPPPMPPEWNERLWEQRKRELAEERRRRQAGCHGGHEGHGGPPVMSSIENIMGCGSEMVRTLILTQVKADIGSIVPYAFLFSTCDSCDAHPSIHGVKLGFKKVIWTPVAGGSLECWIHHSFPLHQRVGNVMCMQCLSHTREEPLNKWLAHWNSVMAMVGMCWDAYPFKPVP